MKRSIEGILVRQRAWQFVFWGCLVCCLSLAAALPPAHAQSRLLQEDKPVRVNRSQVESELAKVEKAKDLNEATRGEIQKNYLAAMQFLSAFEADQASEGQFRADTQQAAADLRSIGEEINRYSIDPDVDSRKDPTQELQKRRSLLQKLERQVKELVAEPGRRRGRLLEIPKLEAAAQERLGGIDVQLNIEPAVSDDPMLTLSKRLQLLAEKQGIEKKLELFEAEQQAYEATSGLLSQELELGNRKIAKTSAEILVLQDAIARVQDRELDAVVGDAAKMVDRTPAAIRPAAEKSYELALQLARKSKLLLGVPEDLTSNGLRQESEQANSAVREMESNYELMRSRVETVGLSDRLGEMLRRTKSELSSRQSGIGRSDYGDKMIQAQLDKFQWQDSRTALQDRRKAAIALLAESGLAKESSESNAQVELQRNLELYQSDLDVLRKSRDDILEKLVAVETDLFHEYSQLQKARTDYATTSKAYADFLDERILWFRSEPMVGVGDMAGIAAAGSWFVSADNLQQVHSVFWESFRGKKAPLVATVAVGLLGLLLLRLSSGSELHRLGELAVKRSCRDYSLTVAAFLQTAARACLFPAIALSIGWTLAGHATAGSYTSAIARGLTVSSWCLLPFEFLRVACRKNGLGESHFGWSEGFRKMARHNLIGFLAFGAPLLFVAVTIEASNISEHNRLGRLAAMGLLLVALTVGGRLYFIFRPGGSAWNEDVSGLQASIHRLRSFAVLAVLAGLGLLLLFAVMGFYESVYKIGSSLLQTVIVMVCSVIAFAMAMRFLLVRRRRLRFEQLIQQRRAAIQAAEKEAQGNVNIATEALDIDLQNEAGLDITDVSRQARELTGVIFLIVIGVVLLAIWQYLLPATKILDGVELWRVKIESEYEFVTARDLLLSLIAFGLTFFGVRNIPGMLELLLLQRLPLDAGARYAVASIFRYVVLVIGLIVALSFLKIPWSNYSWLVAAVSVGLGFGLQEIVANFVSGLILLLERPVRVGDVITVDGVEGVVSRIQMRATTITNWDNQELVVPNKDLISGKLLNWTLSSVINRIALKFGVAYGTDVGKVRELVTKIVERHPDVLKEPKPFVTFQEFGDSSLNFVIRCCTTTIQRRWNLIDEINTAVNEAFEREGIEVPFPQRVVRFVSEEQVPPPKGSPSPAKD